MKYEKIFNDLIKLLTILCTFSLLFLTVQLAKDYSKTSDIECLYTCLIFSIIIMLVILSKKCFYIASKLIGGFLTIIPFTLIWAFISPVITGTYNEENGSIEILLAILIVSVCLVMVISIFSKEFEETKKTYKKYFQNIFKKKY